VRPQLRKELFALGVLLLTSVCFSSVNAQVQREGRKSGPQNSVSSGKKTYMSYCASCHGTDGTGNGPAAIAMNTPPTDLTTLAKRHHGKYPAGFVSAVLKFGQSFAAHGSEDMPVWGARFKTLDPANDPTGQHHVDDLVAYIQSIQTR
jgi:mono/diheme cytochrome c family protein